MNEIIPIKKAFLEKLLKPVNRLSESCVLKTDSEGLFTICSSPDNTVILYAKIKTDIDLEEPLRLNIIILISFYQVLIAWVMKDHFL